MMSEGDRSGSKLALECPMRTPKPSKLSQLRALAKKQFRIDAQERFSLLLRLFIAPLIFLIYAATSLKTQTSGNDIGSITYAPMVPLDWTKPTGSNPSLYLGSSPSISNSTVFNFRQKLEEQLGWSGNELNEFSPST